MAACLFDSIATMPLPAMGYGLRYEYGMFSSDRTIGQYASEIWQVLPCPVP